MIVTLFTFLIAAAEHNRFYVSVLFIAGNEPSLMDEVASDSHFIARNIILSPLYILETYRKIPLGMRLYL